MKRKSTMKKPKPSTSRKGSTRKPTASKPPAKAATSTARAAKAATYTPQPIEGIGPAPFRYPPR